MNAPIKWNRSYRAAIICAGLVVSHVCHADARHLLTTEHTQTAVGNLAIFEAPEPWGPWSTVAYYRNWHNFQGTISFYFAPKWFAPDGKEFTLVFTDSDHWATLRGKFVLHDRLGGNSTSR